MKRFALFIATVALLFNTCIAGAYAATPEGTSNQKKVMFYLKPDITVELNGVKQIFKDVNGQNVYPIIFNGTAYLPVRAISAIMKEPVEWDSGSKTVYIGKTISYPIKSAVPIPTNAAISADEGDITVIVGLQPSLVTGYLKTEVLVMYDFVIVSFNDANGSAVYPLNYDGSTFLPIRAISKLMNEPITWDGTAKKISIGNGEEEPQEVIEEEPIEEEPIVEKPIEEIDATAALMKDIYEREESLYYEGSAKITKIKDATIEDKQVIAASASENYAKAQAITLEVKAVDQTSFTEEEKATYGKLLAFAESNEYYILVLENVAYLAAADSDYSMLAETFLYFAMEAQTKMEEARKVIIVE